jgi:DNA primase
LDEPPEQWTLVTVPRRLARLGRDPWKQYWATAQEISVSSLAAVGRAVRAR